MSELRRDLVSGDWIIMAPERARRPKFLGAKENARKPSPIKGCPFENMAWSGNWPPIISQPAGDKWRAVLIRNRYPALAHVDACAESMSHGPHIIKSGVGEHDLLVTRNHYKNFADLSIRDAAEVLLVMQKRYAMLKEDKCSVYTSAFCNWGPSAGASVYHPHYQVLTLPIVPPDVAHSLHGSERYFRKHKKCVHCVMLGFDLKEKKRIIEKNSSAVALAPFISRLPFEVRVFPLKHSPRFETASAAVLKGVAAVLQSVLKKMRKNLNDPDFNFFIHTAPLKGGAFDYYHWHIEITPKVSNLGGFELGTGIDINAADPEMVAAILNSKKRAR